MRDFYAGTQRQQRELMRENRRLAAELEDAKMQMEYLSMMTDVELPTGEEENYEQQEI